MENIQIRGDVSEKNQTHEFQKEKQPEPIRGKITTRALVGIIVITMVLSSFFGAIFGLMSASAVTIFSKKISRYFPGVNIKNNTPKISTQQVIVEDSAVIDVVQNVSPSVVSIVISKDIPNIGSYFDIPGGFFDPFAQDVPGLNGNQQDGTGSQKQTIGGGSGFFITADGFILTNRHVVEDQQASYTVVTNDGKEYEAKVLSRDPVRDVAIIKIDGPPAGGFPVAALGDSDTLKIGQTVVAIGNSLGEFSNSVSRGIVSGLKRNLNAGSGFGETERLTDIIQTDAAINPGNSGGPLLDIEGSVIGINVAVAQGAQNIGFALPVNQAKRLIDQVKNGSKISVPYLGVRYIVIDSLVQKNAQLPFNYGVLVLRGDKMTDLAVIPGSPADKAGIIENDIILEVNGQKVDQTNQLGDLIARYSVGEKISIKIWHKGETKDVQVKLEERTQ